MNERFHLKSWHIVIYVIVALLGFSLVTVYSTDRSTFYSHNGSSTFLVGDLDFSKLRNELRDSRLANKIVFEKLGFSATTVKTVSEEALSDPFDEILKMRDFYSKIGADKYKARLSDEMQQLLSKAQVADPSLTDNDYSTLNRALLLKELLDAFNKILKMRDFCSRIEVDKYKSPLSPEMQQLLSKAQASDPALADGEYVLLNRTLLEAVYPQGIRKANNGYRFTKHLLWILTSAVMLVVMANMDYYYLRKFSIPILATAVILLVLVIMPGIRVKINGAYRWIRLTQTVGIQPSEFAKLAVILFLAVYIEKYHDRMSTIMYGFVIPLSIVMVVVGLVFKEPDLGTSAFIVIVSLTMLIVGGARIRYVFFAALAALAAAPLLYKTLSNNQSDRIEKFINALKDPSLAHFQIQQSLIAIGSGGMTGLGLGSSKQKLYFLPESSSDFVFTIISEEFGFIGVVVIISLFLLLVWQGLKIIHRTKDLFGFFLGLGITFMFGLQAIVNIAVVSGNAPAKGIPLPFVSSGGSSLLFSMMAIGILVNIARKAEASAPLVESREVWDATEDVANRRLPSRIWHSITTRVAGFSW